MLAHRADIGRNDDVHEGDLLILHALGRNVASQLFIVHLMLKVDLRVHAGGHQVGRNADDGIDVADPPSVRAIAKHGNPSFPGWVQAAKMKK